MYDNAELKPHSKVNDIKRHPLTVTKKNLKFDAAI